MLLDMLCCYNGALLPGDVSMCLWCEHVPVVFDVNLCLQYTVPGLPGF